MASTVAFNANCGPDSDDPGALTRESINRPNPAQSPANTPDATPDVDYSPGSQRVVIPARTRTLDVSFRALRDTIAEPKEYLVVNLDAINLLGRVEIGPDHGTITIENDFNPTLSTASATVIEGASFTVNVDYAHTMAQQVVLALHTSRESAEAGDYAAPSSHTFAVGDTSGSFTVTTAVDADHDDEAFDVRIDQHGIRSNTLRLTILDRTRAPPGPRQGSDNVFSWSTPSQGEASDYDVEYRVGNSGTWHGRQG